VCCPPIVPPAGIDAIAAAGADGIFTFEEGNLPVNYIGELDQIDAYEVELEENIRRLDLDWKDRVEATAQLFELRKLQATKKGLPEPTVRDLAEELRGSGDGSQQEATRQELIVSRHLSDPEVAKAKTVSEGFKILKRKEELRRSAELGELVGKTLSAAAYSIWKGDCLDVMQGFEKESFDVILTDPPYGIDAQDFNDSGKLVSGSHFYDDSYETWAPLMQNFAVESWRIAKPQAHLYMFCDVDRFCELKAIMSAQAWKVFRTPLIWANPTAMRAPWPESGPQRKWQMILYATKGDRPVTRLYPDVVSYPSDPNLNHHAQKPVALYRDLLQRSIRPGDSVIDPFCGSGPIFPAAHELKCRATGIEMDDSAYGIATKRIQELK
jgi:DNA modification methylase